FFFFRAEDGIRDFHVTGVQTCALPIWFPAAIPALRYARARMSPSPRIPAGNRLDMRTGRCAGSKQPLLPAARPARARKHPSPREIGRASCRESVQRAAEGGRLQDKTGQ